MLYQFFSPSNTLLGSVVGGNFIGWQDAGGIARLRITDQSANQTSMLVDHLIVDTPVRQAGAAPEPSSFALVGMGTIAAAWRARRRMRSHTVV